MSGKTSSSTFNPEVLLSHQPNLLDIFFESMPMGIAIFDRELRLCRCNPTWVGFVGRYTPSNPQQVVPGARFFEIAPGTEPSAIPLFEQVLSGQTVHRESERLESGGIVSYWDVTFTPLWEDGQVVGFIIVTTDETARVLGALELEKRIHEERNRLARELHDSVTQTLFSANLIAGVLPRLWERYPEEARRRLDELGRLTQGALSEMRTLLLELRPANLTKVNLDELLRQLAETITGRTGLPVSLKLELAETLPEEVHLGLYRIAQEALNNVARHAGATRASIILCKVAGQVKLWIEDDGRGFDPATITAEHLGVGIMRERAEAMGASLEIESEPGQGTQVEVCWPGKPEKTEEVETEKV